MDSWSNTSGGSDGDLVDAPTQVHRLAIENAGVNPIMRFDTWQRLLDAAPTPRRASPVGRPNDFSARVRIATTGAVAVSMGRTSAVHEHVEGGGDRVELVVHREADAGVIHRRDRRLVPAGSFFIESTDDRRTHIRDTGALFTVISVPRANTTLSSAQLRQLNMTVLPSTPELTGLAESAATALCTGPLIDAPTADAFVCGVVDLIVRAAAGLSSEHNASNTGAQRVRVERFMRANLSEPTLSTQEIADAMGMSRRSVYRAFEPDTPMGALRRLRLERAQALLTDPRQRAFTINRVAHECGYTSPAAFARLFKGATGQTPSDFRNRAALVQSSSASDRWAGAHHAPAQPPDQQNQPF